MFTVFDAKIGKIFSIIEPKGAAFHLFFVYLQINYENNIERYDSAV